MRTGCPILRVGRGRDLLSGLNFGVGVSDVAVMVTLQGLEDGVGQQEARACLLSLECLCRGLAAEGLARRVAELEEGLLEAVNIDVTVERRLDVKVYEKADTDLRVAVRLRIVGCQEDGLHVPVLHEHVIEGRLELRAAVGVGTLWAPVVYVLVSNCSDDLGRGERLPPHVDAGPAGVAVGVGQVVLASMFEEIRRDALGGSVRNGVLFHRFLLFTGLSLLARAAGSHSVRDVQRDAGPEQTLTCPLERSRDALV